LATALLVVVEVLLLRDGEEMTAVILYAIGEEEIVIGLSRGSSRL
jgi:hypothetical protein